MKLEALFKSQIGHEDFHRRNPEAHEIDSPRDIRKGATYKFEDEVFNFLFKNKEKLGILKIIEFKNSIIDGGLILDNKKGVSLEIKYALGWEKSLQARLQLQRFQAEKLYEELKFPKPEHALIIFDDFSGDWKGGAKKRQNINGWNEFYREEEIFRSEKLLLQAHIMQYKDNKAYICNNKILKEFFVKTAK
jgi:hypothetical protein